MSSTAKPYRPRCLHLCSKSMQVYGEDFENDPEYQAGLTDFWCTRTFKNQGPDTKLVSLDMCSNPERECFQEF